MKGKPPANPLIWGAVGGIGCSVFALALELAGSPMPQTVWTAGMAGLFWGYMLALFKNWYAQRLLVKGQRPR